MDLSEKVTKMKWYQLSEKDHVVNVPTCSNEIGMGSAYVPHGVATSKHFPHPTKNHLQLDGWP